MPNILTMSQLQNSIRELGAQIRTAANALAAAASDNTVGDEEINRQRTELRGMNDRMLALREAYNTQAHEAEGVLATGAAAGNTPEAPTRELVTMLKSNEYARAWANAVRNGVTLKAGRGDERYKVLYDALTESGGTPTGSDGGFLVPEDVDHTIRERRRELQPLADLFNVEPVTAPTGWRVVDRAPTTGMTGLTGEMPAGGIPRDDQPAFDRVDYTLNTYGLIVPVSNELAMDEVANLFNYLSNWFAKKQVLTENALLKAKLMTLAAQSITGGTESAIKGIKTALNKGLDPAISVLSTVLVNQTTFDYLDNEVDGTGRPLLTPDPTTGTPMLFKTRPVKMVADSLLPNREVASGTGKGDYSPIYVGDFKEFATLFMRQRLEVASTDVGGDAFATNCTLVRGIARMGVSLFDTAAALRREIFFAAA